MPDQKHEIAFFGILESQPLNLFRLRLSDLRLFLVSTYFPSARKNQGLYSKLFFLERNVRIFFI